MEQINPVADHGEYGPTSFEGKREAGEELKNIRQQELDAPLTRAQNDQQTFKLTVQHSQYTGKGSLVDSMT